MQLTKQQLFKTAYSKIGTASFSAGQCVCVRWYCHSDGKDWYLCSVPGNPEVCLSETWLERFCL